jgi:outer membrane protein assembly factor BamB
VRRRLAAAFAALALGGCASSALERQPPAALVDFTPAGDVRELWSEQIGSGDSKLGLRLSPELDGKVVYACSSRGQVSAFAATDGKRLWETDLDLPVSGGIGIGPDIVVVGTLKGNVVALERSSGKVLWRSSVSSEVLAPPAVGPGIVVVQSADGKIAGLSALDGARVWVYERTEPPLSLRGTSTPRILGDQVVAGFANGKIAGIALQNGRPAWELTVAQPRGRNEVERLVDVDAPMLALGDALFAVSYQGKLIAIDLRGGRIAWSRDMSSFSGMDADQSRLYVTDENGNVLAFDLRTGASVWKQDKLHGRMLNAPTVVDDCVVVGDYEGYLHWLSRDDGHMVARSRVGSKAIRAQAISAGHVVFAANTDGSLAALGFQPK